MSNKAHNDFARVRVKQRLDEICDEFERRESSGQVIITLHYGRGRLKRIQSSPNTVETIEN